MVNEFKFTCTGHENVLSLHSKTIEFTKDDFLTPTGDCIIGINADFDYDKLKKWINQFEDDTLLSCRVECCGISDKFEFNLDKSFNSKHEIVFRRSDFKSDRTLGHRVSKCAYDIDRRIVDELKKGICIKLNICFMKL